MFRLVERVKSLFDTVWRREAVDFERAAQVADFECAAGEFRSRFPQGGLEWHDFRPHFDGFAISVWFAMLPLRDETATREAAFALLLEITEWLRAHADIFKAGDRVQLVVGFPESVKRSGRQIFKCWMPASGLNDLRGVDFATVGGGFRELRAWPLDVAWPESQ